MRVNKRHVGLTVIFCSLFSASVALSQSALIGLKAFAAPLLLERAWEAQLASGEVHKAWPWADSWPVAKLRLEQADWVVLDGMHGSNLAFAPSMASIDASAQQSARVIAAHRDTHFRLLEHVAHGDSIQLQQSDGSWQNFSVSNIAIVDSRKGDWTFSANENALHLITCYPFDSIVPGGPLRLVVTALAI